MQQEKLTIEEQKISDLTTVVNHFKVHKTYVDLQRAEGGFQFLNLYARLGQSTHVRSISGWKNFDYSVIESIWVYPEYQKRKVGQSLIEQFCQKSKDLGCSKILSTTNSHYSSENFWKKCGFQLFSETSTPTTRILYFQRSI